MRKLRNHKKRITNLTTTIVYVWDADFKMKKCLSKFDMKILKWRTVWHEGNDFKLKMQAKENLNGEKGMCGA